MTSKSLLHRIAEGIQPSSKRLIKKQAQVAAELSMILKDKSLTQRGLAKLVGKEESYISKVLNGELNLTLKTIVELEEALQSDLLVTPYLQGKPLIVYKNILVNTNSIANPHNIDHVNFRVAKDTYIPETFTYGMVG